MECHTRSQMNATHSINGMAPRLTHFFSEPLKWAQNTNAEWIAIAIKKAKHGEELAEFFDKEASNLRKIQHYKSPHLIKPIAAYQIDQERCLIFPWADGGNLLEYWKHPHKRQDVNSPHWFLNCDNLRWLLDQLKGICSAVQELHDENTRHGDLKPENILWFKGGNDCGVLQIADSGLALLRSTRKRRILKTAKELDIQAQH